MIRTRMLDPGGREINSSLLRPASAPVTKPLGISGQAGPHRTVGEACKTERKRLHGKNMLPAARRWRFRVSPTAAGFMQVSLNRS